MDRIKRPQVIIIYGTDGVAMKEMADQIREDGARAQTRDIAAFMPGDIEACDAVLMMAPAAHISDAYAEQGIKVLDGWPAEAPKTARKPPKLAEDQPPRQPAEAGELPVLESMSAEQLVDLAIEKFGTDCGINPKWKPARMQAHIRRLQAGLS